jgi:hypothetical protein
MSEGKSNTGIRFMVAVAAPVNMLALPGPIEAVHANVDVRFLALAYPIAAWTIDCSFFA